jgi:hypothetical protein
LRFFVRQRSIVPVATIYNRQEQPSGDRSLNPVRLAIRQETLMRRDTPAFEAFENEFGKEAEREGWDLYLADGGERLELLMSSQNDMFRDDVDAWGFMLTRAQQDPWSAAAAALALISDEYREQIYRTVRQVLGLAQTSGRSMDR